MAKRWGMLLILFVCCVCGEGLFAGCTFETGVVDGFECQLDPKTGKDDCKDDEVCQKGKCIRADKDKDGWAQGKDCNDNNKLINPAAREICENQIDDNCDGKTDEQPCFCQDGAEKKCGPASVGVCQQGIQRCEDGQWGKCEGQIVATQEDCDGLDNDCNGKVDDNLKSECYNGPDGVVGKGKCKAGERTCEGGKWSACQNAVLPTNELCNNEDDDCDGFIDNKVERSCYEGPDGTKDRGVCKSGTQTCSGGTWGECKEQVKPSQEDCDGKDNDCNGKVDEGISGQKCFDGPKGAAGVGACREGVRNCESGAWSQCVGQVLPAAQEDCNNNLDDNCDGAINEGCVKRLFEVRNTIDTDSGEIDGVPYNKFDQSTGTFDLPSLRIPNNTRVVVTGQRPLRLKVTGDVEILGTLDVAGKDGGDINCQSTTGTLGTPAGAGGGRGGDGGNCNTKDAVQPAAGDGAGAGAGQAGTPAGVIATTSNTKSVVAGAGGGAGRIVAGTDGGGPNQSGGKGGPINGTGTSLSAGAGGGGGACGAVIVDLGILKAALFTPGAAGGNGGGAVWIESTGGTILVKGSILAQGGNGGASLQCSDNIGNKATGGGGGGGAGGTVHLRASGEITIDLNALISARGGKGAGISTSKGGDGADGAIILQDADGKVSLSTRVSPTPTISKY